jgi:hypothetical protein
MKFILVVLSLLLAGCDTLSLQPLYSSEKETGAERGVLGRWKTSDDTTIWRVTETKPSVYSIVEEGKNGGDLEARLTRLGGVLFADFRPVSQEACQIPGHLFARVQLDGGKMKIAWIDFKSSAQLLPGHQFIAFEGENRLVLTAPTAQLRSYVEKIARLPQAFQKDTIFQRVAAQN